MSNQQQPPDRIWLQWHGDGHPDDPGELDPTTGDITWCADHIYEHDIPYRREHTPPPDVAEVVQLANEALARILIATVVDPKDADIVRACIERLASERVRWVGETEWLSSNPPKPVEAVDSGDLLRLEDGRYTIIFPASHLTLDNVPPPPQGDDT